MFMAACSTESSSESSIRPSAATSAADGGTEVLDDEMPVLDLLRLGGLNDLARLDQYRDELVAQCMSTKGFEYPVGTLRAYAQAIQETYQIPSRIFADEREAANGYGFASLLKRSKSPDPVAEYLGTLSGAEAAAYDQALMGGEEAKVGDEDDSVVFHGGCLSDVDSTLFGGNGTEIAALRQFQVNVAGEVEARVRASDDFLSAEEIWAGCMRERGRNFSRQPDAYSYFVDQVADDARLDKKEARLEIELALQDYRCQEQAGLRTTYERLTKEEGAQYLIDHAGEVERLRELTVAALPRIPNI
ncbi:MAG: hypothetical protein M3548_02000 [Actinomycetota bacterium]|nr:hypothetical protein [Actinomycetota bacterium]